jgi:hypothetical protein
MTKNTLIRAIVFALSFGGFSAGAAAQGDLCDPEWWRDSATASGVRALAQGRNVDAACPNTADGDYPIHLAVFFADDAGAVEALLRSGAGMARSNAIGQTPATLLDIRLNAAVTLRLPTHGILAIERLVNRGTEAQNLAQNNLCSLAWWRTATHETAAVDAVHQGADPNQDCDAFGNKPIHIALDLQVNPLLVPDHVANVIGRFIERTNVDLLAPNHRGETAVSLMEIRYQAVLAWWEQMIHEASRIACESGANASREYFRNNEPQKRKELALYTFTRKQAGVEGETVRQRVDNAMGATMRRVSSLPEYQVPRCLVYR